MADSKLNSLLERFAQRDRLALARLITLVENRAAEVSSVMEQIYAKTGHAYTTVVVTVPEGGDGVQVMKAGLNEIADLFVVNKADRDGADRIKAELELSVHLRPANGWRAPVLLTQAAADVGVDALVAAIE